MKLPEIKSPLTLERVCEIESADSEAIKKGFRGVILSQPCEKCGEEIVITLPEDSEYFKDWAKTNYSPIILYCCRCQEYTTGFEGNELKLIYANTGGVFRGKERKIIPMTEWLPNLGQLFPKNRGE